jgi:hypothetical protein
VWVAVDGNQQGSTKSRRDEKHRSKEDSDAEDEQDHLRAIDSIHSKAVKIIPAPDLSKSEEKWKGDGDDDEAGDVNPELLSEPAKWIQRMIAEVEGVGTEFLEEGDEETVDIREHEIGDSTTAQPPRELTPLEKQGQEIYLTSYIENS